MADEKKKEAAAQPKSNEKSAKPEKAKKAFSEKYGHEPKVYDVVISDGARKL